MNFIPCDNCQFIKTCTASFKDGEGAFGCGDYKPKQEEKTMNKLINSRSVAIWIDGSCKGNDKTKVSPGGWAALLIDNETKKEKTLSGGKDSTTNNEMELESLHQALIVLKQEELLHIHAVIYTDSQYVIGLFDPIKPWKATSHAKKVCEMRKLFETKVKSYAFVKIRGHSGIKENEYVDAIASGEAEKRKLTPTATDSDSTLL